MLIVSERPHPSHLVSLVLAPVVDSAVIHRINLYPLDSAIGSPIHWIGIYPVDSAIQLLNNWGLVLYRLSPPQRPAWIPIRLAITKNKKELVYTHSVILVFQAFWMVRYLRLWRYIHCARRWIYKSRTKALSWTGCYDKFQSKNISKIQEHPRADMILKVRKDFTLFKQHHLLICCEVIYCSWLSYAQSLMFLPVQ